MIGLRGVIASGLGHLAIAGLLMGSAASTPRPEQDMSAAEITVTMSLAAEEVASIPEDAPPPTPTDVRPPPEVHNTPEAVTSVTEPSASVPPGPVPELATTPLPPEVMTSEPQAMPLIPQKLAALDPKLLHEMKKPEFLQPIQKARKTQIPKKSVSEVKKNVGIGKGTSTLRPASAGSNGGTPAGSGGAAQSRNYAAMILAKLRSARQSPQDGATGRVVLSFTLSASGGLVSANVSGGNANLKSAALGMVQGAAPFPAMPSGMNRPRMNFTVPVQFD